MRVVYTDFHRCESNRRKCWQVENIQIHSTTYLPFNMRNVFVKWCWQSCVNSVNDAHLQNYHHPKSIPFVCHSLIPLNDTIKIRGTAIMVVSMRMCADFVSQWVNSHLIFVQCTEASSPRFAVPKYIAISMISCVTRRSEIRAPLPRKFE